MWKIAQQLFIYPFIFAAFSVITVLFGALLFFFIAQTVIAQIVAYQLE